MTKKRRCKDGNSHATCSHAIPCTDRHKSNDGRPLLGRCPYRKYMFLLSETTGCGQYQPIEDNNTDNT